MENSQVWEVGFLPRNGWLLLPSGSSMFNFIGVCMQATSQPLVSANKNIDYTKKSFLFAFLFPLMLERSSRYLQVNLVN